MCRVLRVARSGWYVWRLRRHQPGQRQQFRRICDAAVRKAFTEAKQLYGAPRLADELPEYNVKTIAASLRRQGRRARPRGGSARSATVSMACRCQRTCCSRIFMLAALTRIGAEISPTYIQMKADCTLPWSSTCGHGLLSAGQCHRGCQHNWRATRYRWRSGDVSDHRMLSFTPTVAASTAQRIIRDC